MSKKNSRTKDNKKDTITSGSKSTKHLVTIILAAVVIGLLVYVFAFSGKNPGENAATLKASDDIVKIPLAQVDNGVTRYFRYTIGGKDIRFFVLKSSDGIFRAAIDACDICFHEKKGYRQEGDFMVCNNCGTRFRSVSINEIRGGCNPVPLERKVEGYHLVIKVADIQKGAVYF